MADQPIRLNITAKDDASKVIDPIAKKVDKLDGTTADVTIKADDSKAKASLDDVLALTKKLDGDTATAVLNVRSDEAKAQLRTLVDDLAHISADDPTITVKLNNVAEVNAELDKIQAELKRIDETHATANVAVKEEGAGVSGFVGKLESALGSSKIGQTLEEFGIGASTMATGVGVAVATAGSEIAHFSLEGVNKFGELTEAVTKFKEVTGASAEESSKIVAVAQQFGVGSDVITGAAGKLEKALGKNIDAFKEYGVQVVTGANGNVDMEGTLLNVLDTMNKTEDPIKRAQLGFAAFGRNWQALTPIFEHGRDEIQAAINSIDPSLIFNDQQLDAGRKWREETARFKQALEALQITIGQDLAPVLEDMESKLVAITGAMKDIEKLSHTAVGGTLIQSFLDVLDPLTAVIDNYHKLQDAFAKPVAVNIAGGLKGITDSAAAAIKDAISQVAVGTTGVSDLLEKVTEQKDPLKVLTDQWETLISAIQSGQPNTAAAANAITTLAATLGLDPSKVMGLALQEIDKRAQSATTAIDDASKATTAYNDAINSMDWKNSEIDGATKGLKDFADAQFAATDAIIGVETAIDGFGKALTDSNTDMKKTKFAFDLSTEAGRKNQQAMEDLAKAVDAQLAPAFADSHGDLAAFMTDAERITDQTLDPLKKQFGLTKTQVEELRKQLGLTTGDFEAKFKLSGDEEARIKLGLLQSAISALDKPTQMKIGAEIAAGDVQGAVTTAQTAFNDPKNQVNMPLGVTAPTQQQVVDTLTRTQEGIDAQNPPQVTTDVLPPAGLPQVVGDMDLFFKNNPAVIPVSLDTTEALRKIQALQLFIQSQVLSHGVNLAGLDQGGTAPGFGGIAGERGPEILNERYLVTRPTYVPPGTRVTSRRRTEQILRNQGTRGLKRYDSGGIVPGAVQANITINTAVIGSPFDVMNAVSDAMRRAERLLPRNG